MTSFFYSDYPVNVAVLVFYFNRPALTCLCWRLIGQSCFLVFRVFVVGGLRSFMVVELGTVSPHTSGSSSYSKLHLPLKSELGRRSGVTFKLFQF